MPEPIVIVTVVSVVGGILALAAAALHTWRYEQHLHIRGGEDQP